MAGIGAYWPTIENISTCIRSEAETISDEVLLAVHQPTPMVTREVSSGAIRTASEHQLLEEFLQTELPEGRVIVPITGVSGSGKSHLIRWLDSQLKRDPRATRMHVIRIPKSASLRTVVELILEPLKDDSRYDDARQGLQSAVADVSSEDASTRFVAELTIALRNLANSIRASMTQNEVERKNRDTRARLDHALRLQEFLADPVVQDYFGPEVLAPIISRSVAGKRIGSEDDLIPQFTVDDLILPKQCEIEKASSPVNRYYQTTLNKSDGIGRAAAVEVLNTVIDQSIKQVFGLNQIVGGFTLEEIVGKIREIFLEDDLELVLLVEDFAALSGIQQVLMDVCIQEGIRDGKRVRCNMRTAIAVTDGDLSGRETVQTRAERSWEIRGHSQDRDEVMAQCVDLVGRYLNAARWGEVELRRRFQSAKIKTEEDLTNWVDVFQDMDISAEIAETLGAFGQTESEIPLFPFNVKAIEVLVDEHLREGTAYDLNPRSLINYVIRDVLQKRIDFENGEFPGPQLSGPTISADVASWLSDTDISSDVRERLGRFISYWCDAPRIRSEIAQFSPHIFLAFGLPTPTELGLQRDEEQENRAGKKKARRKRQEPIPEKQKVGALDEEYIHQWQEVLDRWVDGEQLGQEHAREIRRRLADGVTKAVDWNAVLMRKRDVSPQVFTIPNARGNDAAAEFKIPIATDNSDPSGFLRQSILAVIKFHDADDSWDYPDGDSDAALYANLIASLRDKVQECLDERRKKNIQNLAALIIREARVLGMVSDDVSEINTLIGKAKPNSKWIELEGPNECSKWVDLVREISESYEPTKSALLDDMAAYQGLGTKPLAINPTVLSWEYESDDNLKDSDFPADFRSVAVKLRKTRLSAIVNHAIRFVESSAGPVKQLFDGEEQVTLIADSLAKLLDLLEDSQLWPVNAAANKRHLVESAEAIMEGPIEEILNTLQELPKKAQADSVLNTVTQVGSLDIKWLTQLREFSQLLEDFLLAAERTVAAEKRDIAGYDVSKTASAFEAKMKDLCVTLNALDEIAK